jgi:hypothetical protein
MSEKRRFQIVSAHKSAQKNEKGKVKTAHKNTSVYTGTKPGGAAKKAFTNLCSAKKIRGACALNVTIQEVGNQKVPLTYKNGSLKEFSYSLRRSKLAKPIELESDGKKWKIRYKTVLRKTPNVCAKGSSPRRCKSVR